MKVYADCTSETEVVYVISFPGMRSYLIPSAYNFGDDYWAIVFHFITTNIGMAGQEIYNVQNCSS